MIRKQGAILDYLQAHSLAGVLQVTYREAAGDLGCTFQRVGQIAAAAGLQPRPMAPTREVRRCADCGRPISNKPTIRCGSCAAKRRTLPRNWRYLPLPLPLMIIICTFCGAPYELSGQAASQWRYYRKQHPGWASYCSKECKTQAWSCGATWREQ